MFSEMCQRENMSETDMSESVEDLCKVITDVLYNLCKQSQTKLNHNVHERSHISSAPERRKNS